MPNAAAYGRISTDEQRATSIDDQIRRCKEVAAREKLTLEDRLIFSDYAITGTAKGTAKRVQYQRLLDAIEARECTVVIADEISRLTRHMTESVRLMDLVDATGIRVITADGIDTARDGWKTLWVFKMLAAHQEVESTSDRTIRGLIGQLTRGYQIAQPPFGYRGQRQPEVKGESPGTLWVIHEAEAAVVRNMFQMRHDGFSAAGIAARLQELGILPPGYRRCKGKPFWRAASVYRILSNAIYRGVFVWNGSSYIKAKSRKRHKEANEVEFERPKLRIVEDELWFNRGAFAVAGKLNQTTRTPRGGGKNVFSGLIRCGDCAALLSVKGGPKSQSIYCPQCEGSKRVHGRESWIGYSSVGAARAALEWVLQAMFSGEVLDEFHCRLRTRLEEGPALEEKELRERLSGLNASLVRLKALAMNPGLAEMFVSELTSTNQDIIVAKKRLEVLGQHRERLTPEILEQQLAAKPLELLHDLLQGLSEPYKVRATLRRLLAGFDLIARQGRGCSVFRFKLMPGVCVAEASDTVPIDMSPVCFDVTVSTTSRRPVVWKVSGNRI
jgi:DNA invertase Pin-like site-specific DNA recombinase